MGPTVVIFGLLIPLLLVIAFGADDRIPGFHLFMIIYWCSWMIAVPWEIAHFSRRNRDLSAEGVEAEGYLASEIADTRVLADRGNHLRLELSGGQRVRVFCEGESLSSLRDLLSEPSG